MISFRYLSNDVIHPSAFSHYYFPWAESPPRLDTFHLGSTNLSSFPLLLFFFFFIFELQVEFLLGDFHEIRMTEYPLFWESFLHLNDRCSSWTELAVNRNRKS